MFVYIYICSHNAYVTMCVYMSVYMYMLEGLKEWQTITIPAKKKMFWFHRLLHLNKRAPHLEFMSKTF